MIAWIRKLWRRLFPTAEQELPPIVTGLEDLPPNAAGGWDMPTSVLDAKRTRMEPYVGGITYVLNTSSESITLEGPILRRVTIRAGQTATFPSPILELQQEYLALRIVEWDAFVVLDNMVKEYARGRAYDLMTPEELMFCTFPFPDRALGVILERVGLKVYRDTLAQKENA